MAFFQESMAQGKSDATLLSYWLYLPTDQTFQMRYITFLKSLWFKNDQPSDLELKEKVRLSKDIPRNQKYFHNSNSPGWSFLIHWEFRNVMYLICFGY